LKIWETQLRPVAKPQQIMDASMGSAAEHAMANSGVITGEYEVRISTCQASKEPRIGRRRSNENVKVEPSHYFINTAFVSDFIIISDGRVMSIQTDTTGVETRHETSRKTTQAFFLGSPLGQDRRRC
jgi:hypothetical protein